MKKLTVKEVATYWNTVDRNVAEEVYAKLVALRMGYEVHKDTNFDPEFFKQCYHIALQSVKDYKLTKVQLCGATIHQSKELEKIGFTRQLLLNLAGLDIE